jgi:hypothetical protein
MRKSRILPKVAWHANMTDGRRVEMMDTANMSATTLVMTRCWSRAQEEGEEKEETRMKREGTIIDHGGGNLDITLNR